MFPALVRMHFRWRKRLDDPTIAEAERDEIDGEYHDARARLEGPHGEVVSAAGGVVRAADGAEDAAVVGCLVAGAVGAVVSVMARVNSGSFALDVDIARGYTLFLGGLRPLIGSVFGLLSYFARTSGFIEVFKL